MLKGVGSVIGFNQVRRMDLFNGLPGVVAFGIFFPFDEVLELHQQKIHLLFST
jgi:hypothetical protein